MAERNNTEVNNPPPPPALPNFGVVNVINLPSNNNCLSKSQNIREDIKDIFDKMLKKMKIQKKPFVLNYRYLTPILQEGPTCGLAALSMVTSCQENIKQLDEILRYTKARGFTNNGEMFSADYLAETACALTGCEVEVLDTGLERKEYIITEILRGALLLVPYDADFNHTPCLRKGHRAHWAVINGILLEGVPPQDSFGSQEEVISKANCIQYLPKDDVFIPQNICKAYSSVEVYVLARQGKSVHPAVWGYEELKSSNENISEFDHIRASCSNTEYVLPPDGVEGGLKGKALLLKGFPSLPVNEVMTFVKLLSLMP